MISKYSVYRVFELAEEKGEKIIFRLDKATDSLYDSDTDEYVCSIETYMDYLAKKLHCNFEVLYSEHGTLTTIYRCKECGTVIFGGDDERWDPNLKCPGCGGYETRLEYWTGEDIKNSPEKQKEIEGIIQAQKDMDAVYARREKRNGLNDWEIWVKKFYGKMHLLTVSLECSNLFYSGLKGLNLHFSKYSKESKNDIAYTSDWFKRIPLSPYAFYIQCIFPYLKKCPSNMRKYYPWQRKVEKVN